MASGRSWFIMSNPFNELHANAARKVLRAPSWVRENWEDAMISARVKVAVAAVLFFSFATAISWAQVPSSMDADSTAIKQCVAAWEDAWNRHDARATAMAYVEDGDFSSTTGIPSHGWKELETHYNEIFTTFLK